MKRRRVRDDPAHPDPGFAELYAALPEVDDLWPWLDWCLEAEPPILYLGIGAGRIAAPLRRAGVELVGVDAHPQMLTEVWRRIPDLTLHQALIEDLQLRTRFELVIGPSSIFELDANLAAAVRHLKPGGRIGMELMNPQWLKNSRHRGVRIRGRRMEVDYRLPDGSVVVQVVDGWSPPPAPERTRRRLQRFALELVWLGPSPGHTMEDSPTYYVLAGLPAT